MEPRARDCQAGLALAEPRVSATVPEGALLTPDSMPTRNPPSGAGWEKLVNDNIGWLRGWVRGRVSDPDLVHDICQDSFLKALRSIGELKDVARFPSWLHRIAENTLRDHLRRITRRRRWLKLSPDLDEFEGSRGAGEHAGEEEEAEQLLATIRRLPARYREPLLLKHSRDLSYEEIGRILRISQNAVQVRICRARKMLREKIEAQEAHEAQKAYKAHKAQDAREAQETQEPWGSQEAREAREAQETEKPGEAQERQEHQEPQEAQQAREARTIAREPRDRVLKGRGGEST